MRFGFLFIVLFCLSTFGLSCSKKNTPSPDEAINKGVAYLKNNQLSWGGFITDRCDDPGMTQCAHEDKTLFIPVLIGLAVHDIESEELKVIRRRLSDLFVSQLPDEVGAWEFYFNESVENISSKNLYFPDLDDTALVFHFLNLNNINFNDGHVRSVIESNMKDGLYLTSLKGYQPPPPFAYDVDPVVNAQVMMVLDLQDEKVCSFINNSILNMELPSIYYREYPVLYYMLSRAWENGVSCIEPSIMFLRNKLEGQMKTILTSSLYSAMYLTVELKLGVNDNKRLDKVVRFLLEQQKEDGSWPSEYFFHGGVPYFYGSEALTTALAIEALHHFNER